MTQSSQTQGGPSDDWAAVLEQIRQAVKVTLGETIAQKALPREGPEPAPTLGGPASLDEIGGRLGKLQQLATEARQRQTEQDEALAQSEGRLRRWLEDAEATRRRLAEWAARGIG